MRPPGGPDKHVQCFLHVFCLPCFCILNFTTSSHRDFCVHTLTNDVRWSSSELFLPPSSPIHSPTHFDTRWPLTLLFVSVLGHRCCTLRFWNDNSLFILRPFAYHLLCNQPCPWTHICCRSILRTGTSVYTNCFQLWCFLRWVARRLSYCLLLSHILYYLSWQSNNHSKYTSFTVTPKALIQPALESAQLSRQCSCTDRQSAKWIFISSYLRVWLHVDLSHTHTHTHT